MHSNVSLSDAELSLATVPSPVTGQEADPAAVPPGLDEVTTRVYLSLIRQPQPSRASLISQGFRATEVDLALPVLAQQRLVVLGAAGAVIVLPPDVALSGYANELEERARTSRSAAPVLNQLYLEAQAGIATTEPGRFDVRVLASVDEVDRTRLQITSGATRRIDRILARHPRTDQVLTEQTRLVGQAQRVDPDLPRGARRVAFDSSVLEIEGALDGLRALRADGVDVRLVPDLPFSVIVVDDAVALLDISNIDPTGYGSVIIRHRPLVQAVSQLTSRMLATATPLPQAHRNPALIGLTPRDEHILSLLAAGATDSTIARQVRVSQRTVERRVRTIMDALGATTRFQAGVQAGRRRLV